jgi:hypothetical protein
MATVAGVLLMAGSVLYLISALRPRRAADVSWGPSRGGRVVWGYIYDFDDPTKPVIWLVPAPPFDWSKEPDL